MPATQTSAVQAGPANNESLDVIYARCEGATVVPFSRNLTPPQPQAYASLNGAQVGERELSEDMLSKHELLSVNAVLTHIAHSQDVDLEVLQAVVEAEFSVTSLSKIPLCQFHNVMEFLIDLRMDSVRSRR